MILHTMANSEKCHFINVIYRVLFGTMSHTGWNYSNYSRAMVLKSSDENMFHAVIVSVSADVNVPQYAACIGDHKFDIMRLLKG